MAKDKKDKKKKEKGKGKGSKGKAKDKKSKAKGSKGSKTKVGSKTSLKSNKPGSKGSATEVVKSANAKPVSKATPEQINKNAEQLAKICKLLESLKPDQVTRTSKDDLDKIQLLIKNITFRDNGETGRVHDVPLSDKQKHVIKLVSDAKGLDEVDTMAMTVTEGNATEGKSTIVGEKINFPFEKLDFVQTK